MSRQTLTEITSASHMTKTTTTTTVEELKTVEGIITSCMETTTVEKIEGLLLFLSVILCLFWYLFAVFTVYQLLLY